MFEKLKDVAARYEQINEKLMDPTVVSDNNQYKTLMKEHKNLTPIVRKNTGNTKRPKPLWKKLKNCWKKAAWIRILRKL